MTMNQSIIDHIRATTPKGTRNQRRSYPEQPRELLGRYLILSALGLGISGLITIIYVISTK